MRSRSREHESVLPASREPGQRWPVQACLMVPETIRQERTAAADLQSAYTTLPATLAPQAHYSQAGAEKQGA